MNSLRPSFPGNCRAEPLRLCPSSLANGQAVRPRRTAILCGTKITELAPGGSDFSTKMPRVFIMPLRSTGGRTLCLQHAQALSGVAHALAHVAQNVIKRLPCG